MPQSATDGGPTKLPILTTGIGSLPFCNLDEALDHVFSRYSLPFLPQLPRLAAGQDKTPSDDLAPMLAEVLTPDMKKALRRRDVAAFTTALGAACTPEVARQQWLDQAVMSPFLARLAPTASVKAQLIGPLSAELLISSHLAERPLPTTLSRLLWRWTELLSLALVALLAQRTQGAVTLLWDDGPLPLTANTAQRHLYQETVQKLTQAGAHFGVHSCAPVDLGALTKLLPRSCLAVDLSVVDVFAPAAWRALCLHLCSGGSFIFGIFDTATLDRHPTHARHMLVRLAQALDASCREVMWRRQVVVSGGCGTGLHTDTFERSLADELNAASLLAANHL